MRFLEFDFAMYATSGTHLAKGDAKPGTDMFYADVKSDMDLGARSAMFHTRIAYDDENSAICLCRRIANELSEHELSQLCPGLTWRAVLPGAVLRAGTLAFPPQSPSTLQHLTLAPSLPPRHRHGNLNTNPRKHCTPNLDP
eukprot:3877620-Rhodomonas_salina.1